MRPERRRRRSTQAHAHSGTRVSGALRQGAHPLMPGGFRYRGSTGHGERRHADSGSLPVWWSGPGERVAAPVAPVTADRLRPDVAVCGPLSASCGPNEDEVAACADQLGDGLADGAAVPRRCRTVAGPLVGGRAPLSDEALVEAEEV